MSRFEDCRPNMCAYQDDCSPFMMEPTAPITSAQSQAGYRASAETLSISPASAVLNSLSSFALTPAAGGIAKSTISLYNNAASRTMSSKDPAPGSENESNRRLHSAC